MLGGQGHEGSPELKVYIVRTVGREVHQFKDQISSEVVSVSLLQAVIFCFRVYL